MTERVPYQLRKIGFVCTGGPGDAGAFERALRLCERSQAELSIVNVVKEPPSSLLKFLGSWGATSQAISGEEEASAEVNRLVEAAEGRGVKAAGEILQGSASIELIRKVAREGYDLLVKSAQPVSVVQHILFGHTDRQLIRKCPCPVWIDKPSGAKTHDRILAAVDPAPFPEDPDFDRTREALNTAILQFAVLLAQTEEAELHVVHVWSFDVEGPLLSRTGLTEDVVAKVGKSIRQQHEQAVDNLIKPFLPQISRLHLLRGEAGEEIARLARDLSVDVVAMGTVCRTGIGGLLIGNTAETVLDHVDCSIAALKPNGFRSPIATSLSMKDD